jgi:hypothetical protein
MSTVKMPSMCSPSMNNPIRPWPPTIMASMRAMDFVMVVLLLEVRRDCRRRDVSSATCGRR